MIGIIGFGRFGKLVTAYLARDFEVLVFHRREKTKEIEKAGARGASLSEVCRQNIVIPCVPISVLLDVLQEIAPLLKKDALVVDVCSVKAHPIEWMKAILPETVSILATHPMFGPDSAADSLKGRKIFLCPVRIQTSAYQKIKTYLSDKGLVLVEGSAAEHDEQIAVSLSLTHFIGRTLSEFGAVPLAIDTEGYKRLLHILAVVENDTWQLFEDMNRYNPYAAEKRNRFMDLMHKVNDRLEKN